ncbi:response regulator transcription factor [Bordetella sp. 02P26C-1]|uniref:response regulator transcription factor n=1 Tax=Bordetella sp. 02P26C-1 TaxID=2683195 RepID=UPI0013526F44|nr:response regulator transcription factor [Bordetella sp. 02P26C-1]MVW80772.1 response regulator [Bordetella sp. 02P26C-1]
MQIASLEDDLNQAQLIQQVLVAAGYTCHSYQRGRDLIAALRSKTFDLILLDWQVPDIAGDQVLRHIRGTLGLQTPVIFLTSRTLEAELVQGLEAGADDYIGKPLRPAELMARIGALLRRVKATLPGREPFSVASYRINPQDRTITLRGEVIALAPKEFELAQLFFRNVGRLLSRDVLAESVWNREIPATSRTLDTHLSNIRQKLRLHPDNGVRLISSYALGYRLELTDRGATAS